MKNLFSYFFILYFLVSCSNRDEDIVENVNSLTLPKTLTTKSSSGDIVSEYKYDGNKITSIISNNGRKSIFSYTGNFITKSITYDSSGEIEYKVSYEYANNKLSKENYKYKFLEFNIFPCIQHFRRNSHTGCLLLAFCYNRFALTFFFT